MVFSDADLDAAADGVAYGVLHNAGQCCISGSRLLVHADVHGFRTSFRTWSQERTNVPREVAEFALAHVVGDAAEQAYARSDLFEKRRKMMEAWAAYLTAELGKVVRIG